jgi:hypothetical protein
VIEGTIVGMRSTLIGVGGFVAFNTGLRASLSLPYIPPNAYSAALIGH